MRKPSLARRTLERNPVLSMASTLSRLTSIIRRNGEMDDRFSSFSGNVRRLSGVACRRSENQYYRLVSSRSDKPDFVKSSNCSYHIALDECFLQNTNRARFLRAPDYRSYLIQRGYIYIDSLYDRYVLFLDVPCRILFAFCPTKRL